MLAMTDRLPNTVHHSSVRMRLGSCWWYFSLNCSGLNLQTLKKNNVYVSYLLYNTVLKILPPRVFWRGDTFLFSLWRCGSTFTQIVYSLMRGIFYFTLLCSTSLHETHQWWKLTKWIYLNCILAVLLTSCNADEATGQYRQTFSFGTW